MVSLEKVDPDGQDKTSSRAVDADPTISTNKHLTRLVRFSILQARRTSSQASKASQKSAPSPVERNAKREPSGINSNSCLRQHQERKNNSSKHNSNRRSSKSRSMQSDAPPHDAVDPHAAETESSPMPLGFSGDKERPSTEVQYDYNVHAHHRHHHHTYRSHRHPDDEMNGDEDGGEIPVVAVPGDPPIIEDLSASLTLSAGEEHSAYSGDSLSDDEDDDEIHNEDIDLLLAPDSGSAGEEGIMRMRSNSSNELYNSAEMYSSSGNYDDDEASQSSAETSESSDSIMRRVEEEIANARKASCDAQARLAYFTQRQKNLAPVMTDSYSFDFENLEASDDLRAMLDVENVEDGYRGQQSPLPPQRQHQLPYTPSPRGYLSPGNRGVDPPSTSEDHFTNAMGVIGQEFESNPSSDIQEKLDIEVVLASSQNASPRSQGTSRAEQLSPRSQSSRSPGMRRGYGHGRSPRIHSNDSVDIDEAVIAAVFSEKSIESLPVKESLQAVLSEQSMDSLPTQPTQSTLGIEKPGSFSFQDASFADNVRVDTASKWHGNAHALSPDSASSQKEPSAFPVMNHRAVTNTPQQRLQVRAVTSAPESYRTTEAEAKSVIPSHETSASPATPASLARRSKLPSTPRDPSAPSYRERLENKLKILGSRYPTSPTNKTSSPAPRSASSEKKNEITTAKIPRHSADLLSSPKETISVASTAKASPLGEAYDGLESRIKDLLARTLNPNTAETPRSVGGEKDAHYNSSPSAELKAIKKLLEQGVAAAAAAEEKEKEKEKQGVPSPAIVTETNAQMASLNLYRGGRADDLVFPELNDTTVDQIRQAEETHEGGPDGQVELESKTNCESKESDKEAIRLLPRSSAPIPLVLESVEEGKETEPDSSVAFSTSQEILEQLDSFSQSNEFKSNSRKSSSSRMKPASSPEPVIHESGECEGSVYDEIKVLLSPKAEFDSCEEAPDDEIQQDKSITSPMTLQEQCGGEAAQIELVKHDVTFEAHSPSPNDNGTSTIDEACEVTPRPSSLISEPREEAETAKHEDDKVGATAEHSEELHTAEIMANVATERELTRDQEETLTAHGNNEKYSNHECTLPRITSKKTPSILNEALSRPSSNEIKDRKNNCAKTNEKDSSMKNAVDKQEHKNQEFPSPTDAPHSPTRENMCKESTDQGTPTTMNPSDSEPSPTAKDEHNQDGVEKAPQMPDEHDETYVFRAPTADTPQGGSCSQADSNTTTLKTDAVVSPVHPGNQQTMPAAPKNFSATLGEDSAARTPPLPPPSSIKGKTNRVEKDAAPQRAKSVSVQSPKEQTRDQEKLAVPSTTTRNETAKGRPTSKQERKIRFRDPYPTPKPCRKPRSTEEIQRDHSSQPSQADQNIRLKEPKGDLKRLLVAALDTSLSRRSNACGALKVISKVEKNKIVLVRTKGFLDALVFVATDEVNCAEPEAKEDARARAISCLYNVAHVKENRIAACMHPGLLDCLVKTINEDRGEARMEACGVLAQLAKNPVCRECMVQVDDLLSTLASVLKGTIEPEEKLDMISEDVTDDIPSSSYSEMSSVLSEEHIPFPKNRRSQKSTAARSNCSIRKQRSDMYDQYFDLARLSSCAALIHLSKQCSILDHFCSNMFLLESIVQVARDFDSKLHCKCLEMLCNISRLPANATSMTRFPGMVDTLLAAGSSKETFDRIWALRTLQNLTADATSKAVLATSTLLTLLINCVTSKNEAEQHAAMATLLNLSTDPSAVVPITSTKNVLATLVYLAHNVESTSEIRLMACNSLATVGLWLQTVSGFGSIPEDARRVLLPSHKTTGWDIWD